jgi:hypothetical protein
MENSIVPNDCENGKKKSSQRMENSIVPNYCKNVKRKVVRERIIWRLRRRRRPRMISGYVTDFPLYMEQ